ncbi:MAG TPA: class I SAM-dependent methyltransferase [Sphingomicrobium sp.]|jgi:ubiquinone/menaquinone biosynthesis C-methylase UbiE
MWNRAAALSALLLLISCRSEPDEPQFPAAKRDVAPIVSDRFSTEDARDRRGEAEEVMQLAGVSPGMWVADVGAGEGYYAVRLARMVGPKGRVLAEDIVEDVTANLGERVSRERLDNVAIRLGTAENPMLPARSFHRVFLVHMYHEVTSPYAFLWHLRDGLKPNGEIVVVDADRPIARHGTPPQQLKCEFAAVGLAPTRFAMLSGGEAYFMAFRAAAPRPEPGAIKPCRD